MEVPWQFRIRAMRPDITAGVFYLMRDELEVAFGAFFPSGKTVLNWDVSSKPNSVVVYDSFEDMFDIHVLPHENTGVVWLWRRRRDASTVFGNT